MCARVRADIAHDQPGWGGYREYWSEFSTCRSCPYRTKGFSNKSSRRQVTRQVWQDALEQANVLGKQTKANISMPGAKKTLNDISQKQKNYVACAMHLFLELATWTNSLSSSPQYRTWNALLRHFVSFFHLSLCFKGLLPKMIWGVLRKATSAARPLTVEKCTFFHRAAKKMKLQVPKLASIP